MSSTSLSQMCVVVRDESRGARLIRALPSYDDWSAWTVSVHNERGSLVETRPFPTNTDRRDALHFEEGIERWVSYSPPHPHQTGSTRYH